MPILHMQTEAVRAAGQQINQTSESLRQQAQQLRGRAQQLANEWQGPSASMFEQEMQTLLQRAQQSAEMGVALNQKVQKEVDEWERVAANLGTGGGGMIGIGAFIRGQKDALIENAKKTKEALDNGLIERPESIPVNVGEPFEKLTGDGAAIPLYKLNLDNWKDFNAEDAAKALDTGGRPVLFIVHGWGETEPGKDDKATFQKTQAQLEAQYAHLSEAERPIIVGIEWDSGKGIDFSLINPMDNLELTASDYKYANKSAEDTGKEIGEFLGHFNKNYPDTSVNVMTHSLGAKMMMHAVQSSDVKVERFLAIQGAVDINQLKSDGDFSNMGNKEEVGKFGATFTRSLLHGDRYLRIHELSAIGDGSALGRAADKVDIEDIKLYDLGKEKGGTANHYGLDHEVIHEKAVSKFFSGDNPFGKQKVAGGGGGGGGGGVW